MKYLGLMVNNLLRNRRRTLLTVSSIAISLFLIATLLTVLSEIENPPTTPLSALRLVVRHRVSLANILPKSYLLKIARVEGVEAVIGAMWFGGKYKDPKNFFAQFAADTDGFFEIYADMVMPEDQKTAFLRDRTGAIAGDNLAARFGWKVGDKITLEGTIFDVDAELTLRGTYSAGGDDGSSLFFHWQYFNEGMRNFHGNAEWVDFTGFYLVRAESAEAVPAVAERIDALFRNTSAPTLSESEKAFMLGFLSMMGNVRLLVTSICFVVIFTIILVAANTIAMSIRERVREIGILKALGFRKAQVLWLLLGESVLLALIGALLGSLTARILFSHVGVGAMTGGFFQRFYVTPATLAVCTGIGLFVGLVSAGIPAWHAARRPVLDALRGVD